MTEDEEEITETTQTSEIKSISYGQIRILKKNDDLSGAAFPLNNETTTIGRYDATIPIQLQILHIILTFIIETNLQILE